jgi:hypothetical protein
VIKPFCEEERRVGGAMRHGLHVQTFQAICTPLENQLQLRKLPLHILQRRVRQCADGVTESAKNPGVPAGVKKMP